MSSHALPPRQQRRRLLIGLAVVAGIVGLVATATVASGKTSIPSADETAATTARVLDASDWYLTLPTGSKGKPDTVQPAKLADYSSKWFHAQRRQGRHRLHRQRGRRDDLGQQLPAHRAARDERLEAGELVQHPRHAHADRAPGRHRAARRQARGGHRADPRLRGRRPGGAAGGRQADRAVQRRAHRRHARPHYALGTPYDLTLTASGGRIRVSYNGAKKLDIAKRGSGWYFKSGSYVQSNTSKGDKPSAVGVVVIYKIAAKHTS